MRRRIKMMTRWKSKMMMRWKIKVMMRRKRNQKVNQVRKKLMQNLINLERKFLPKNQKLALKIRKVTLLP